jgi:hypothetical protein
MISEDLGNGLLSSLLLGAGPTWLSLHTAEPEPGTDLHELPLANNYGRQLLTGDWSTPAGMTSTTTDAVIFPTAGGSWGTITWAGICDAETGGALLMWGELLTPRTIDTGETIQFSAGQLSVEVESA